MPYAELKNHADGARIEVTTAWSDKELIKSVPGARWAPQDHVWWFPLSWSVCVQLRGTFRHELKVGPALQAWAKDERFCRVNRALELRLLTAPADPTIDTKPLYDFQWVGTEFMDVAGSGLLGDEMGTGKTIQLLSLMANLGPAESLPAVVICPNGVKVNWAREAAVWFPEATPYVVAGTPKLKKQLFVDAAKDPTALVIINYESVRLWSRLSGYGSIKLNKCRECDKNYGDPRLTAARCEVHPKELQRIPFKFIVIDEAHRIKDPHSKQTRAVWAVGHQLTIRRGWLATGTPIANAPDDLWAPLHAILPQEYPSRTRFIDRYCLQGWDAHGGLTTVGLRPDTREEFDLLFDPRFRRMPKALVLDQLPPKVYETRYVEMSPKQAKAYADVDKQYVTKLEDGTILAAPNDLIAQVRLTQFASSYVEMVDEHQARLIEPCPKLDELMLILDELGTSHQVAVSSESRQLIELAEARFIKAKISYSKIVGGMNVHDRDWNLQRFQEGRHRVMLFTLKAGGTGLTMTAADVLVRIQRSWSMIDNKQGEDRVHRIGSEKHESVTIIDIVTQNTVEDQVQLPRLLEKTRRLEQITRDRALLLAAGKFNEARQLDDEESVIMASNLGI